MERKNIKLTSISFAFLALSILLLSLISAGSDSKTLYFDDYKVEYSYEDAVNNDYFNK